MLFLPDFRIILNSKQFQILAIDKLSYLTSPYHTAILKFLSQKNLNNRDKIVTIYIEKINITLSLGFLNKHIFISYAYNEPTLEVKNMLVFLVISLTNY